MNGLAYHLFGSVWSTFREAQSGCDVCSAKEQLGAVVTHKWCVATTYQNTYISTSYLIRRVHIRHLHLS